MAHIRLALRRSETASGKAKPPSARPESQGAPAPASAKIGDMATSPTLPPIHGRPPSYRLVVKRRTGGIKGYGWEIRRSAGR
jgi:hypothetical protein